MTIQRGPKGAVAALLVLTLVCPAVAGSDRGVRVTPGNDGAFEYVDDFQTARFLDDAFLSNLKIDQWSKGAITNRGPNRNRTLTYRFYSDRAIAGIDDRVIAGIDVHVDQSANGPNLGARNMLYLSLNGLDWTRVASSSQQKADHNGWQTAPLEVPADDAKTFLGASEIWVRVVLDNYCGLKTNESNRITRFAVKLTLGEEAEVADDPQAALREAWGVVARDAGWRAISLDWNDPVKARAPHYYEDGDGWLVAPGAEPNLAPDERAGFPVHRALGNAARSPLALAMFIRTEAADGPLLARIIVKSDKETSRSMKVLWDREDVTTFDPAQFFTEDKAFFVEVPGPHKAGVRELRITAGDTRPILVRRITVAGAPDPTWVEKPPLPAGGRLELLAAAYLPDPAPPPESQAVEGRHKKQEVGLILSYLQRLYEEHGDFGALRIAVRNPSKVPVRIARPLLLNGGAIEESYVDFVKSAWDARGVVWYRVRPRLLAPGACGEIYIRFRRRPEGQTASLTIPVENGAPVDVTVPYTDPALSIDYATIDESGKSLYVYVRALRANAPGVASLALDGKTLVDARVFGKDYPGGVALVKADLPTALEVGAYHVVQIADADGSAAAAQFRVLPFLFPRSSIHVPLSLCAEQHMNLAMWRQHDLESCRRYDLVTTGSNPFDSHARTAFIMGPDEPDAHDNRGGGYGNGLGAIARDLAHSGWQQTIERQAFPAASWIIMNGTVRPLNWGVYGRFADIACFDPYPVTYYAADHAYVRESLGHVRRCATPNRMYACLEAYGWTSGQGVPKGARGPTPEEYRQNVVQAIGAGMKGLTSWTYVAGAGGWQVNEPVAKEIANVNALIEHIEDLLLIGAPVDLVTSDAGAVPAGVVGEERWPKERVAVAALLCGPDAIVVTAANHIPASKPDPPIIEPAKNVTLTVTVPAFLSEVECFEVTEEGLKAFPCTLHGVEALLELKTIVSGRVFVLARKSLTPSGKDWTRPWRYDADVCRMPACFSTTLTRKDGNG